MSLIIKLHKARFVVDTGHFVFCSSASSYNIHSFPTRRSSDLGVRTRRSTRRLPVSSPCCSSDGHASLPRAGTNRPAQANHSRSEEHTSELQSHSDLVCRLLLEKKKHQ